MKVENTEMLTSCCGPNN